MYTTNDVDLFRTNNDNNNNNNNNNNTSYYFISTPDEGPESTFFELLQTKYSTIAMMTSDTTAPEAMIAIIMVELSESSQGHP